jgi:hypothetical protein
MSEISIVVVGSTSINSVVGNGDSVNVNVGDQTVGGGNGQAATIQVGTVTTIDATQTATVTNVGSAYAAKFNFSLPRGYTGSAGPAASLSISKVSTGTTAAVSISGTAPSQSLSFVLQPGPAGATGPANSLSIGSVSTGATAAVSISGTAPSQTLSFVLPQGPAGPPNSLSIGSVTTGTTAAVSISGTAPSQTISLVLPAGPKGDTGATGPQGPAGSVNLADETPQPLGTASAGTALAAARADHVHAQGSIAYSGLTGIPSTFAPSAHTHTISSVTGLQDAIDGKQAAGTYATLVNGTVPSSQLPSYVDDVIEYANLAAFTEQSTGKIYVARDTGKIYRWSGSTYVEISPSPGSTDSVTEGSTNLYFTNARAAAAAPVQSVAGRTGTVTLTKSDVGLGSVDNTADTAKPISTAVQAALDGKAATSHTHSLASLTQSSATTGQVPTWNGTAWAAATPSGGSGGDVDGGDYVGTFVYDRTISITQNPTDQTAVSGNATVSVTATASPLGTLTYQWQRYGSTWADVTGGTSYFLALTGLTTSNNGDRYRCVVSAQSAASVTSGEALIGVNPSAPSAPTGLSAVDGDGEVTLSWTTPSNGGSSITTYVFQYSTDAGSSWTTATQNGVGATTTTTTINSLNNGTAYLFRVAARNSIGTGSYATSDSVTPNGWLGVTLTSGQDFGYGYGSGAGATIGGNVYSSSQTAINKQVTGYVISRYAGTVTFRVSMSGSGVDLGNSDVSFGDYNNSGPQFNSGNQSISVLAGGRINFGATLRTRTINGVNFEISASLTKS